MKIKDIQAGTGYFYEKGKPSESTRGDGEVYVVSTKTYRVIKPETDVTEMGGPSGHEQCRWRQD